MTIAALIIGVLALIISIISLSWQLGKHWSSHVVQLQSVEDLVYQDKKSKKIGEEFRAFDEPLTEEEQAYFDKHKK